ncbi:MAG: hypothetical protein LUI60_05695 [Clostridia bacterium]|nr:hypothetical protein [Clostridia bacterium]
MKRRKITFVCSGNTCRSPMAEALLRSEIKKQKIKWWDVTSCGIFAEVGGTMSPNSRQVLQEIGISADKFAPKQLTQSIIEKSEVVICMTDRQKQILDGCGKVYSMKEICGYEVPDPYGCSVDVYRMTREAIKKACPLIIEKFIVNAKPID